MFVVLKQPNKIYSWSIEKGEMVVSARGSVRGSDGMAHVQIITDCPHHRYNIEIFGESPSGVSHCVWSTTLHNGQRFLRAQISRNPNWRKDGIDHYYAVTNGEISDPRHRIITERVRSELEMIS